MAQRQINKQKPNDRRVSHSMSKVAVDNLPGSDRGSYRIGSSVPSVFMKFSGTTTEATLLKCPFASQS